MTEDEMVGWHHRLNGHEFEQTPGDSEGRKPGMLQSQFSSVQLLSRFQLFATPWIAAHQAFMSITYSQSLLRLMSIQLLMPPNHLILCLPLLLLPSILPSIMVFSNESVLPIRWPKYWNFSFSISPSNEYSEPISFSIDWFDLQSKGLSRVFSNTTVQKYSSAVCLLYGSALTSICSLPLSHQGRPSHCF